MPLGIIAETAVFQKAAIAYLHYLSFMICFGALILERKLLKISPSKQEAISMLITDLSYGVAALLLLVSGILRVLYFGQGSEFYLHNPVFWLKVGLFISVGLLSLYPTITYILWLIPLREGKLPEVDKNLVELLAKIINIELFGFALIPFLATLMSRGVGLS
tara:strand:+ start:242 stop:727 length:486 start_codon:yes stop_codon:yes gene_type:complete